MTSKTASSILCELNVGDMNSFPHLLGLKYFHLHTANNNTNSIDVLTGEWLRESIAKHCGSPKRCGTRSIMDLGFLPVAPEREREFDDS